MTVRIINADVMAGLAELPDESVHCVVTSPPYWGLRDYGVPGQIGLEPTPDAFVARMVDVFREVRRVLRADGTCWLNLGDSHNNRTKVRSSSHQPALNGFADDNWADRAARGGVRMSHGMGLKEKDLCGIPWRVALALQADGWWLRSDIIWAKPNPMPESVTDRPTKAHEYLFLLSKAERYYYDAEAIQEQGSGRCPGNVAYKYDGLVGHETKHGILKQANIPQMTRNARSVWTIATAPFAEAHFATFPPELPERCIKAGCPKGGTVLDPFGGAGTTALVADRLQRNAILIELNPEYAAMAEKRIFRDAGGLFADVDVATPAKPAAQSELFAEAAE
jgi:DNA modification methylase